MLKGCLRTALGAVFLTVALSLVPALIAQTSGGAAGQIQGVVSDASGAVVPGATLILRDMGTGIEKTITSGEDGHYTFLALQAGNYELTVSKAGFQKSLLSNIVVATSRITDQQVTLSVGSVVDTVEVQGQAPVLETSSSQLSITVQNKELQTLPLSGRDTLPFATLMPGNQNVGVGSQSGRTGTFNGLPNASMNISMDGMNNNSQRFKSGGTSFFAFATARLDAVQEVTVTTAGTGADASGDGAMQIQFVTKRGTEDYHFKVFEQFQNDALNATSFFNNSQGLAKTKLRQNDVGGNFGGPLPIPFVPYFKHRLFFFANFEATPIPGARVSTATILTQQAQLGAFSYLGTDKAVHTVNLLNLAARSGYSGTIDPTVANLLGTANSTLSKGVLTSSTTDLIHQTLTWNQPTTNNTYYPTTRVDYQISPKVAWHGTWNLRYNNTSAYPQYPDLPVLGNAYKITTYIASNTVDWTIKANMLNSATFGVQSNGEYFYQGTDVSQWGPYGNRYVNLGLSVTPIIPNQTPFIRNNPVYQFKDTFTWLKGKHSISIGASWLHSSFYETTWNAPGGGGVPTYTLGVASSDPINSSVFTNANFPAIASTDLANAAQLYATLTGRLSGITGGLNVDENTHQYTPFAPITQRFAYTTSGLFAQDSFHVTPHLTLNYGFRWQFTTPIRNTNNIDLIPDIANFYGPSVGNFQPGVLTGVQNPVLTQQSSAYRADYKQPAPNFGFAWNPGYEDGWLGKILGRGTVIRGSYGLNFYDEGMNAISNVMSGNYGSTQALSLSAGQAGFTPGALSLTSSIPGITGIPSTFSTTLPQAGFAFNNSIYAVDPNLRVPYVQNWTFGVQRKLSDDMVFEARYVGNKATHMWHYFNTQETNIFENGFLSEFVNAQKNLNINLANGRTGFANNGLPGQVALPIIQTAFGARGSQAALPASFTNGTFVTQLQQGQAGSFAQTLATNITYYCRLVGSNFGPCASNGYNAAGSYPINFFQANPYATNRYLQTDDGNSNYNGLQLELRKAVSHGLSFNANYTWSHTMSNIFNSSDQTATSQVRTLRNSRLDYGPTPFDIRHVFQGYWTYSLPVGKGRALNISNPVLNAVVGGWNVSGIHRWTSGHPFKLVTGTGSTVYNSFNNFSDAGVTLNGISVSQLQSMFNSVSSSPNRGTVNFVNSSLIGSDGRANPQYLAPNQIPGTLGANVFLYGPGIVTTDAAISKEIPIKERFRFGIQAEAINVFNHPVFSATPSSSSTVGTSTTLNITSTSFGQTTQIQVPSRNIQLRAYIQF